MPVISIPYDHGSAVVLTDACLVITSNGVFENPKVCNIKIENNRVSRFLTPAEFRACNWRRVVMARHIRYAGCSNRSIQIRVSVYDTLISERLPAFSSVSLSLALCPLLSPMVSRLVVPRMVWLGTYKQWVERRLALAMVNHERLGKNCLLQRILSHNDIASMIIGAGDYSG